MRQIRACLVLLVTTVVVCCVAYPLALWLVGSLLFAGAARGSLVDRQGRPAASTGGAVGSRLIAQPFAGDGYFHPRPSAVSYDAAASGASNWGASNYLLRERVAQALGPVATYAGPGAKAGQPVGPDIEAWLHEHPGAASAWAEAHAEAPARWLKAAPANHKLVAAWKARAGQPGDVAAGDVAPFFAAVAVRPRGEWPEGFGPAVQAVFFESWLDAHRGAALSAVPADAVTASGSGLDPHVTLANALGQLDRVAAARAAALQRPVGEVRREVERLVRDRAEAPLGGLAGGPLVNVLELNLDLDRRLGEGAGG